MKIEVSEKLSNEVRWDTLKPGDVVSWGGNLFLAFAMANRVQFLNLDEFKAVTYAYVSELRGLPTLMDSTLQVSHVGAELTKFKDPWEFQEIDSTWITEARYNRETHMFEITTETDQTYQYRDVPEYRWLDFLNAWSQGGYYNANIKGQYERVE